MATVVTGVSTGCTIGTATIARQEAGTGTVGAMTDKTTDEPMRVAAGAWAVLVLVATIDEIIATSTIITRAGAGTKTMIAMRIVQVQGGAGTIAMSTETISKAIGTTGVGITTTGGEITAMDGENGAGARAVRLGVGATAEVGAEVLLPAEVASDAATATAESKHAAAVHEEHHQLEALVEAARTTAASTIIAAADRSCTSAGFL